MKTFLKHKDDFMVGNIIDITWKTVSTFCDKIDVYTTSIKALVMENKHRGTYNHVNLKVIGNIEENHDGVLDRYKDEYIEIFYCAEFINEEIKQMEFSWNKNNIVKDYEYESLKIFGIRFEYDYCMTYFEDADDFEYSLI